jgi:lipoprotein-anchoring transpeptidase ErfK/SrfK
MNKWLPAAIGLSWIFSFYVASQRSWLLRPLFPPSATVPLTAATIAPPATKPPAIVSSNPISSLANWSLPPAFAGREKGIHSVERKSSKLITKPTRLEVDLSARRLTFYWEGETVKSYPIAIGRRGWETPTGTFKVLQMKENPNWIHPLTNQRITSGNPKNPLGSRWIGFWSNGKNWIGFHGTPDRKTVGKEISHGCIRMFNEDIEELFELVNPGTAVVVKH